MGWDRLSPDTALQGPEPQSLVLRDPVDPHPVTERTSPSVTPSMRTGSPGVLLERFLAGVDVSLPDRSSEKITFHEYKP